MSLFNTSYLSIDNYGSDGLNLLKQMEPVNLQKTLLNKQKEYYRILIEIAVIRKTIECLNSRNANWGEFIELNESQILEEFSEIADDILQLEQDVAKLKKLPMSKINQVLSLKMGYLVLIKKDIEDIENITQEQLGKVRGGV